MPSALGSFRKCVLKYLIAPLHRKGLVLDLLLWILQQDQELDMLLCILPLFILP